MQTVPTQQAYMDAHKARLESWGMLAKPEPVIVIPNDRLPRAVNRKLIQPLPMVTRRELRGEFTGEGRDIVKVFVATSGWSIEDLKSNRRSGGLAAARNHLIYLLITGTTMDQSVIGWEIGGRTKHCVWASEQRHKRGEVPVAQGRKILHEVAENHGYTVPQMCSTRRLKPLVRARHEAMWRMHMETALSYPQIGRVMGGMDHTTVMHGVRRYQELLDNGEI